MPSATRTLPTPKEYLRIIFRLPFHDFSFLNKFRPILPHLVFSGNSFGKLVTTRSGSPCSLCLGGLFMANFFQIFVLASYSCMSSTCVVLGFQGHKGWFSALLPSPSRYVNCPCLVYCGDVEVGVDSVEPKNLSHTKRSWRTSDQTSPQTISSRLCENHPTEKKCAAKIGMFQVVTTRFNFFPN